LLGTSKWQAGAWCYILGKDDHRTSLTDFVKSHITEDVKLCHMCVFTAARTAWPYLNKQQLMLA